MSANEGFNVFIQDRILRNQRFSFLCIYESVLVQEVVTKARDTNNDAYKIPDTMATDGTNYYPLPLSNDEGVSDAREDQGEGTKQTYKLADLIREMIDNLIANEGNSSPWKAYITKDQNQQDVLKVDDEDHPLEGAEFKLYREVLPADFQIRCGWRFLQQVLKIEIYIRSVCFCSLHKCVHDGGCFGPLRGSAEHPVASSNREGLCENSIKRTKAFGAFCY